VGRVGVFDHRHAAPGANSSRSKKMKQDCYIEVEMSSRNYIRSKNIKPPRISLLLSEFLMPDVVKCYERLNSVTPPHLTVALLG
jgi:hypothetical protein